MILTSSNAQLLNSIDMILIFCAFFVTIFLSYLFKKSYYYFFKKQKFYIFPKTSIKGIAFISMTIALTVAILILITIITSDAMAILFRAFPGTRITLEAILIKIGGLLFGPFIGMFIGGVTDLLSIAMTAGIFHYGYFITALTFGLLGGLVKVIASYCRKNIFMHALISSISLIAMCVAVLLFMYFSMPMNMEIKFTFIIEFGFFPWHFMVFIASLSVFAVLLIISFYLLSKRKKDKWFKNNLTNFVVVISLVFFTEIFVNIFMLPVFDADLSTLSYVQWLAIRSLLFVPMVIFNTIVIWPIYKIINPLIKYNYVDDAIGERRTFKGKPIFI